MTPDTNGTFVGTPDPTTTQITGQTLTPQQLRVIRKAWRKAKQQAAPVIVSSGVTVEALRAARKQRKNAILIASEGEVIHA